MSNDLDDILNEFQQAASEKPKLTDTLEKMDNDHFMRVAQAVNNEYIKRVDASTDVANLSNGEFAALRARYGV